MKFKRRFYDSTVNFRNISKQRFIISIIIGLASAFTIYSFIYVLRESFRVLNFSIAYLPTIDESNRFFYNLFFAGLAVVYGNSIFISSCFKRPQKTFSNKNPKKTRILNDQIFLNAYFLSWFSRLFVLISIFSIGFVNLFFFPDFKFFFILILVVLFLDSWKTLSLVLGKRSFKLKTINLVVVLVLSYILANINIVDYKNLNVLLNKINPTVNLPKSYYESKILNRWGFYIDFKLALDDKSRIILMTNNYKKISFEEVSNYILEQKNSRREEMLPFLTIRISADNNVKIKYIKRIEREAFYFGIRNVNYMVFNNNLSALGEHKGIGIKIPYSNYIMRDSLFAETMNPYILNPVDIKRLLKDKDILRIKIGKEIKINDLLVPHDMLVNEFQKYINKSTVFEYNFTLDIAYQDYITVLSAHFRAIQTLRQSNASKGFDILKERYLFTEEQINELSELKARFPTMFIEKIN
jgi:hypothetical protein